MAAALSAVFALSGCAQKESKELTIYCALPETEIPMYLDAFKNETGMSPTEYATSIKAKTEKKFG